MLPALLALAALAVALADLAIPTLARSLRAARLRELAWRQAYLDRTQGD